MTFLSRLLATRRRRIGAGVVGIVAVPALALAWWLGSPLFLSKTVDEEFPFSANAVIPDDTTREEVETTMAVLAGMDTEMIDEAMPVGTPDEPAAAADPVADTGAVSPTPTSQPAATATSSPILVHSRATVAVLITVRRRRPPHPNMSDGFFDASESKLERS